MHGARTARVGQQQGVRAQSPHAVSHAEQRHARRAHSGRDSGRQYGVHSHTWSMKLLCFSGYILLRGKGGVFLEVASSGMSQLAPSIAQAQKERKYGGSGRHQSGKDHSICVRWAERPWVSLDSMA